MCLGWAGTGRGGPASGLHVGLAALALALCAGGTALAQQHYVHDESRHEGTGGADETTKVGFWHDKLKWTISHKQFDPISPTQPLVKMSTDIVESFVPSFPPAPTIGTLDVYYQPLNANSSVVVHDAGALDVANSRVLRDQDKGVCGGDIYDAFHRALYLCGSYKGAVQALVPDPLATSQLTPLWDFRLPHKEVPLNPCEPIAHKVGFISRMAWADNSLGGGTQPTGPRVHAEIVPVTMECDVGDAEYLTIATGLFADFTKFGPGGLEVVDQFSRFFPGLPLADTTAQQFVAGGYYTNHATQQGTVRFSSNFLSCPCDTFDPVTGHCGRQQPLTHFALADVQTTPGYGEDGIVSFYKHDFQSLLQPALHNTCNDVTYHLVLSGPGDDRVTAVAYDPDYSLLAVGGYISSGDVDFRFYSGCQGEPHQPTEYEYEEGDGKNIFVALYVASRAAVSNSCQSSDDHQLIALWTFGGANDDVLTDLTFASDGTLYACGYMADAMAPFTPDGQHGDIWVAAMGLTVTEDTPCVVYHPELFWQHVIGDASGDDRAYAVTVDQLNRCVVAGQFGFPVPPGVAEVPPYCLDFDPGTGNATKCVTGGTGAFLARYWRDGDFDFAGIIDGGYNERAVCVAVEPFATGSVAVGGSFGGSDAPQNYTINSNPLGSPAVNISGSGMADGFTAFLDMTHDPTPVRAEVAVMLENTHVERSSVETNYGSRQYAQGMIALKGVLVDAAPSTPASSGGLPIIPRDGSVALSVTLDAAVGTPGWRSGYDTVNSEYLLAWTGGGAAPLMPTTVISDERTAQEFALRMASVPAWHPTGLTSLTGPGRRVQMMFEDLPVLADWRAVVTLLTGPELVVQFPPVYTCPASGSGVLPLDPVPLITGVRDELFDHPLSPVDMISGIFAESSPAEQGNSPSPFPCDDCGSPTQVTPQEICDCCALNPSHPFCCELYHDYLLNRFAGSREDFSSLGVIPGSTPLNERHVAFSYITENPFGEIFSSWGFLDPDFYPRLTHVLRRSTVCPGDYDRDGDVDAADLSLFIDDLAAAPAGTIGTHNVDWNGDRIVQKEALEVDKKKFDASFAVQCGQP